MHVYAVAAITGSYFGAFFLTLHSLDIKELISNVKLNNTNLFKRHL
ncbi:hypothetical protein AB4Z08_33175 [Chitinophaga sp. RAB17]